MRDGYTRQLEATEVPDENFVEFTRCWSASIVVLTGNASGEEYPLDQPSTVLGRGDSAHLRFEDPSMSSEHAALEFFDGGIRLRDLGSMNGTLLNGSDTKAAKLKHGDRFQIGALELQFVLSERDKAPKTYEVPLS